MATIRVSTSQIEDALREGIAMIENLQAENERLKEEITARDDRDLDRYAEGKKHAEDRLMVKIEAIEKRLSALERVTPVRLPETKGADS